MRLADPVRSTLVIIGAGFSGTALAWRLLRPGAWHGSVVLIERSGRFGPGLAYASPARQALLNVAARDMSIDEQRPDDFLDFLRSRGIAAQPDDFVPRRWYGRYLETRLDEATRAGGDRQRLVRISGLATSVSHTGTGDKWQVAIADGRTVRTDCVVLAVGHSSPARFPGLSGLEGSSRYVAEPWSIVPATRPGGRVLIIGTGLTMADVVCELADRPDGPGEIVAISRRGLLAQVRRNPPDAPPAAPRAPLQVRPRTLRALVTTVRREISQAQASGADWRPVVAALRGETVRLWTGLSVADRRRFLRHLQPYWDSHRHQLPPSVGATLRTMLDTGRLEVRAARIVGADPHADRVTVTVRPRGLRDVEPIEVDQVINCTGPDPRLDNNRSSLVRSLLEAGLVVPDPNDCGGALVDAQGRLIGRDGRAVDGLYCLGPWLRARDWEATAAGEIRLQATKLAECLPREQPAVAPAGAVRATAAF